MSEEVSKMILERDPEFLLEYMKAALVEDIYRAMESEGMNKSQLAKRMGKSRQYVGRVLNETANFTLETVARIAAALEKDVVLRLKTYSEVFEIKNFVYQHEYWSHARLNMLADSKKLSTKKYSSDETVREIRLKAGTA